MSVFFKRRGDAPLRSIQLTITGTGDQYILYMEYGNVKFYSPTSFPVEPGHTITFGVYGGNRTPGVVSIDGVEVLINRYDHVQTYVWKIPQDAPYVYVLFSGTEIYCRTMPIPE